MLDAAGSDVLVVIVAIEELDLSCCTSEAVTVRVARISAALAAATTTEGEAPLETTTKHTAITVAVAIIPFAFAIIDLIRYYSATIVAFATR